MGPQGDGSRDALTLGFQQQYPDIQIDYQGMSRVARWPPSC